MPIIQSSIKDMRRIKRRTARNRAVKSSLRSVLKRVRTASTADEARKALRAAMQALDKARAHGVIPRNTASRTKARLSRLVDKKFPR